MILSFQQQQLAAAVLFISLLYICPNPNPQPETHSLKPLDTVELLLTLMKTQLCPNMQLNSAIQCVVVALSPTTYTRALVRLLY